MPVQTFLATGLAAHVVLELQPRFRPDLAPIRQQTFSRHYTAVDERSRMQVLLPRLWLDPSQTAGFVHCFRNKAQPIVPRVSIDHAF